ncbi:hypothetical protein Btru_045071 [Bulinus truncatus]|nr:hypothetical protein Btru_045071 [Bulinus truncatus]
MMDAGIMSPEVAQRHLSNSLKQPVSCLDKVKAHKLIPERRYSRLTDLQKPVTNDLKLRMKWQYVPTRSSQILNYDENSVLIICQYCNAVVNTYIRCKPGKLTCAIAAGLCIIGLWPCACLPFCVDSTKDLTHVCPNCDQVVGRCQRFNKLELDF